MACELDGIIQRRGKLVTYVSDKGTELSSMVVLKWERDLDIDWHDIRPGATVERFCREPHRAAAQRVSERDAVFAARRGPRRARRMTDEPQPRQVSLIARQPDAISVPAQSNSLAVSVTASKKLNHGLPQQPDAQSIFFGFRDYLAFGSRSPSSQAALLFFE